MSQLKVNSIVPVNGLPSGANGGIIQVVQTVKTDVFTHNSTSFADITGLSATITPSSNSSKILCDMRIYISLGTVSGSTTAIFNLVRGSTNIAQPAGSNVHNATLHNWSGTAYMSTPNMNFLDSPATTSATTYKVQVKGDGTAAIINVNKYYNSANYRGISTLTLYEVTA
tara:strand:+ start:1265 stop:1774 length:510 start_codon:yes stop_codon:yes gene_type:complete